jgi:N-carbamoylputrescine amidase
MAREDLEPANARRAASGRPLSLGLVQLAVGEDPTRNLAAAADAIADAAARGAEVICLPELFAHRYPCQREDTAHFDLAEPLGGATAEWLSKRAAAHGVVLVGSIFERRAPGLHHNTALIFGPDGERVGVYRKMHIPDDPLYQEKFYFAPGDLGFPCVETGRARIGPLVCWDQWFPEAARASALAGSEILIYPTAIGWQFDLGEDEDRAQHDAWETVQRGHAIANGVFVAAVNRVGFEPTGDAPDAGIRFFGQSFVCDPRGRVLARASADDSQVLVVECDLSVVEATRRDWPFLRDRRVDAYGALRSLLDD